MVNREEKKLFLQLVVWRLRISSCFQVFKITCEVPLQVNLDMHEGKMNYTNRNMSLCCVAMVSELYGMICWLLFKSNKDLYYMALMHKSFTSIIINTPRSHARSHLNAMKRNIDMVREEEIYIILTYLFISELVHLVIF